MDPGGRTGIGGGKINPWLALAPSLSHGGRVALGFLYCSLWSCLVLRCKCRKIKLMISPGAGGGGPRPHPWHPAPVIFLGNKETGCLTSGGNLGALHSLRLENIFVSGDRWVP